MNYFHIIKQYTHISTGAIYEVIKQGAKVIVLRCVKVGTGKYQYIGMDTKTSPAGFATFYKEVI